MLEWTVMVYMAGDNDLDSNGIDDLFEIKRVGSTDKVAVIAQFDRSGTALRTKRYHLHDFEKSPRLSDDKVDDLGETNSGSKEEFINFLNWGLSFGAKRNLVVIWGHGTGTDDTNIFITERSLSTPATRRRGIFRPKPASVSRSFVETLEITSSNNRLVLGLTDHHLELVATDDEAEDFLDNVELKEAFNSLGRRIDIVGMDACLMSMAEICYQLRENVGITVASQAQTDKEGWPYERILRKLVTKPEMLPEELSGIIVTEFIDFYKEHDEVSAALTACRLEFAPKLAGLVNELANALIAGMGDTAILNGIITSRRMVWDDEVIETVDLRDLCGLLKWKCNDAGIDAACTNIINFIDDRNNIVIAFDKHGDGVKFARGIGIYFPEDNVSSLYGQLDFVSIGNGEDVPPAPRWETFIAAYVNALTTRP